MTCLNEVLKFGKEHEDVFGAEKIKEDILRGAKFDQFFGSIFSTRGEYANTGKPLTVCGISNPTVADMNFRPRRSIRELMVDCQDYISQL